MTSGSQVFTNAANVESFAEMHLALLHPLWQYERFTLEGGAGLSLGVVDNHVHQQISIVNGTTSAFDPHSIKIVPSPLVMLGIGAKLTARSSIRLDAAWVNYANRDTTNARAYNLSFSGVMIRPSLQVRL